MNKSIFVGITLAAVLAAMLVVSNSGLLQQQDADATASKRDRVNKVLDEHIKRSDGTAHGEEDKREVQ